MSDKKPSTLGQAIWKLTAAFIVGFFVGAIANGWSVEPPWD